MNSNEKHEEIDCAAFDAFGQTASNALTGVLTGSMSVSEALQSIGSNVFW